MPVAAPRAGDKHEARSSSHEACILPDTLISTEILSKAFFCNGQFIDIVTDCIPRSTSGTMSNLELKLKAMLYSEGYSFIYFGP